MNNCLLFCLVLATSVPCFSQGRDTAFAVHKLFTEKRGTSAGLLSAGNSAASSARYAQRPDGRPTAQEARQDALFNTAVSGVGMFKGARYSGEHEAYVLRVYAGGGGLPPDVRHKLRRRHFHRTAKDLSLTP